MNIYNSVEEEYQIPIEESENRSLVDALYYALQLLSGHARSYLSSHVECLNHGNADDCSDLQYLKSCINFSQVVEERYKNETKPKSKIISKRYNDIFWHHDFHIEEGVTTEQLDGKTYRAIKVTCLEENQYYSQGERFKVHQVDWEEIQ